MPDQRPRLMLFSPRIAEVESFVAPLREALSGGDVAAVVVEIANSDPRDIVNALKLLAPIVQSKGAALLVADHPESVVRGGADGVHLSDPAMLQSALDLVKSKDRIVGVAGLKLRDDAMAAAEQGIDYVQFGERRPNGSFPPLASVIERVSWWAEIFETPCVGFAPDFDAIDDLAATGAEFVACGDTIWAHEAGPAAAVEAALRRLAHGMTA